MEYTIIEFKSLDSTNNKGKEIGLKAKEGTIILAEEQTKGKGRLGRSWHSTKGKDILMSIVLKPNITPSNIHKITLIGIAAVNRAIKDMKIDSQIKWPNDIIIDGKKVAGILTEASSRSNKINYIILGIGINVNSNIEDIPKELQNKSSSLKILKGSDIDKEKLIRDVLHRFREYYIEFKTDEKIDNVINIYKSSSAILGREIFVIKGNGEKRQGVALDIGLQGELIVEFPQGIEKIYAGEVSIRSHQGYV